MLATTALFALSGVTVAAADISISGHVRFQYDSWSDDVKDEDSTSYKAKDLTDNKVDTTTRASAQNNNKFGGELNLWVKGEMVSDNGMTYGGAVRIRENGDGSSDIDRRYITMADDWGKITLGRQWSPTYSMSLGQDWRGTISYGDAPDPSKKKVQTTSFDSVSTSGKDNKIIYETPDISGFKAGVSMSDAGSSSKANSTEYIFQYGMSAFGDGSVKVSYAAANQSAKDSEAATNKNSNQELGAEVMVGDLTASVIQFNKKATPNTESAANKVSKQSGQELEVAYAATPTLTLNTVFFTAKVEESGADKDDKYKWTGVGAKYTIAPGLWASLSYKTFKYTDATADTGNNDGNAYRLRVHASY
jgi:predicted porin